MALFNSETAREAGKKSSRKSVPNRITPFAKDNIHKLLTDHWETALQMLSDLESDPAEWLKAYDKFMSYVVPKKQELNLIDDTMTEEELRAKIAEMEEERKRKLDYLNGDQGGTE